MLNKIFLAMCLLGNALVEAASAQVLPEVILLSEANVENAYPRWSQDGKRILFQSNKSGKWQLYILDIETKRQTAITQDSANNNFPDWSFDNQRVAFVSDRNGNEEVYVMNTDGTGLQRITSDAGRDIHPYFSPDGKFLLFNSTRGNSSFDIFRYDFSTGETRRLTDTNDDETCARYAPDLKRIVYLRNGTLTDDVFILNTASGLSDNVTNTPKSRDGWPMFSHQGDWIYFSSMEKGSHSIYRIKPDGTGKEQLTQAAADEEDARVCVGQDGKSFIYNKRKNGAIDIRRVTLQTD